jgi:hypothetical protein
VQDRLAAIDMIAESHWRELGNPAGQPIKARVPLTWAPCAPTTASASARAITVRSTICSSDRAERNPACVDERGCIDILCFSFCELYKSF